MLRWYFRLFPFGVWHSLVPPATKQTLYSGGRSLLGAPYWACNQLWPLLNRRPTPLYPHPAPGQWSEGEPAWLRVRGGQLPRFSTSFLLCLLLSITPSSSLCQRSSSLIFSSPPFRGAQSTVAEQMASLCFPPPSTLTLCEPDHSGVSSVSAARCIYVEIEAHGGSCSAIPEDQSILPLLYLVLFFVCSLFATFLILLPLRCQKYLSSHFVD